MQAKVSWLLLIVLALIFLGCSQPIPAKGKVAPSKLEAVEGTDFKRVILTEKAAERVGIQTVPVRSGPVTRTRQVGGEVVSFPNQSVPANSGGGAVKAQLGDSSHVWVRVILSESELAKVDRAHLARVVALWEDDEDVDGRESGVEAELDDDVAGFDDDQGASRPPGSASLYYALKNNDEGLAPGQPVLVDLILAGSGAERKIAPFAALIYGVHGETWVYTNPKPLEYVRASVTVDFIDDDEVYLLDGPSPGTQVVTVGGSLLYGAETGVSK